MNKNLEIFTPADQWILPPPSLLDEEFDDDNGPVESLGIHAYDHKHERTSH